MIVPLLTKPNLQHCFVLKQIAPYISISVLRTGMRILILAFARINFSTIALTSVPGTTKTRPFPPTGYLFLPTMLYSKEAAQCVHLANSIALHM